MKMLRKYWNRLRITDQDAVRAARSFWLQMACTRFPEVKSAAELCRIAEQFQAWHFDAAVERIDVPGATVGAREVMFVPFSKNIREVE